MNRTEPQAYAAMLRKTHAWADVVVGDTKGLSLVEAEVRALPSDDVESVLSGMRCFIDQCRAEQVFNVSAMSKLFVLNRYVFDVPEFTPLDQPRFGGFLGIPVRDRLVNELWPWQNDGAAGLRLTGFFHGYVGESYLALEEAAAFRSRYGPRQIKKPGDPT